MQQTAQNLRSRHPDRYKRQKMKKQLIDFKDSFKLDAVFLKILLFDLLFYAVIMSSFAFIGFILKSQSDKVDLTALDPQYILQKSAEELQVVSAQIQNYFAIFIFTIILSIIIFLAAWSLSRSCIAHSCRHQFGVLRWSLS